MSLAAIDQIYRVVAGDSLSKLAQRFYGDPRLYPRIAERNNINPQAVLYIGQRLIIPPRDGVTEDVEEVQVTAQHLPELATLPAASGGALVTATTGIETVVTSAYVWWKDWRWYAGIGGVALVLWMLRSKRT